MGTIAPVSLTAGEVQDFCGPTATPETKLVAARAFAGLTASYECDKNVWRAIQTLAYLIKKDGGEVRKGACRSLAEIFGGSYSSLPSTSLDPYKLCKELIQTLNSTYNEQEQAKVAMALSSVITYIFLQYDNEETIGIVSERLRKEMTGIVADLNSITNKENKSLEFHVDFIREALKELKTNKSKTDRLIAACFKIVSGVLEIAHKNFSSGFKSLKDGVGELERSESWFSPVIAIRMLEASCAQDNVEVTEELCKLIKQHQGKSWHVLFQGIYSLGNIAIYSPNRAVRIRAFKELSDYSTSKNPIIREQCARMFRKVSIRCPDEDGRRASRNHLLTMNEQGDASFTKRKLTGAIDSQDWKEGKAEHSLKDANKEKSLNTFSDLALSKIGKSHGIQISRTPSPQSVSSLSTSPGSSSGVSAAETLSMPEMKFELTEVHAILGRALRKSPEEIEKLMPDGTAPLMQGEFDDGKISVVLSSEGMAFLADFVIKEGFEFIDLTEFDMDLACLPAFFQRLAGAGSSVKRILSNRKITEEEAEHYAKGAIMLNGHNVELSLTCIRFSYVAEQLFSMKRYDLAEEYVSKAIALGVEESFPKVYFFYRLRGTIRENLGQREAEADFKKALELKEDFPDGLISYAKFLLNYERWEETLKIYEKIAALSPGNYLINVNLSSLYLDLWQHLGCKHRDVGLVEESKKYAEIAKKLKPADSICQALIDDVEAAFEFLKS